MGLFDNIKNLFSRPKDPTRDWGRNTVTSFPPINLHDFKLGSLRFNDGVDSARFLGRATRYEQIGELYFALYYTGCGARLEFEEGKFYQFEFNVHEGNPLQIAPDLILTTETTADEIKGSLGKPREEDVDEDEVNLFYSIAGNELEFELAGDGRLTKFVIYADDSND